LGGKLNLKDFFTPKSVAIIGASAHPEKIGFATTKNILDGNFGGNIYPINPDQENILGLKCYPNVAAVKGNIDLAVVIVPAVVVCNVIAECGKKKIKYAIIISAGFGEAGPEGVSRQEQLKKVAELYNIRILGPNCLGVIDPIHKLNASFATNMPEKRNIAVVSQSGATCTAILDWANGNGIGFSHFVSLGNKVDLNENDFLDYYAADPDTKVVIGYLESISEPENFLEIARRVTKKKPLILLKAGRTSRGGKAASSHTGALACDDDVVETAFREAGIIRAETLEDLFELATIFSDMELPKSGKTLILTNAGGPAVMTTDSIAKTKHLSFYDIEPTQKDVLSKVLPFGASVSNPIDLLGDATSRTFEVALKVLSGKKDADLKLIVLTPQSNTDSVRIAEVVAKHSKKDTVVVLIGGPKFDEARATLAKNKIPTFLYPERAVFALDKLAFYSAFTNKKTIKETWPRTESKVAAKVLIKGGPYNDTDIAKILMAYDIPMAGSKLTTNANEAIKAANEIGYPVVLKVTSPDILHKTEAGAVKLGIEDNDDLRKSYQEVLRNARKNHPKAQILGVTVYRMVRSNIEVAIGAKRDPLFGPVIMFGLGGIYIEIFKDFRLGLAPVSIERATEIIHGIKTFEMLNGYRNGEHFDIEALATAISGLSLLMTDFPGISEVDVNPIRVNTDHKGILALDAKIIFEKAAK
jgi:acetyl coenzyme A synthetase (ADP forming)-like protein